MIRIERLLLWVPLLLLLATPLAWGATGGDSVDPTSPTDKQTWVTKIRDAQSAITTARARYERAVEDYSRMRSRRKSRGEAKRDVMSEREEASQALTAAEQHLEVLLESARRAGVPPGWVREALEPSPASRGGR